MRNEYIVYALYRDNEIVYIGRSTKRNIKNRISNHRKTKRFDSYGIICEDIQSSFNGYPVNPVGVLENFFIGRLKPILNKTKHNDFAILMMIRKKDLASLLGVAYGFGFSLKNKEIIDRLKKEKGNIVNILKIKYTSPSGTSSIKC